MVFQVLQGDCREVLKTLDGNSVDSVVTDPPYELSNDGKASANRIFIEMMFPEKAQIYSEGASGNMLSFLVEKILGLHRCGHFPAPTATMPIGAVTLDNHTASGNENIEHAGVGSISATDSKRLCNCETKTSEHLGCFVLELADTAAFLNALNHAGCGFFAGRLGVGFGVGLSGLPSLFRSCGIVNDSDTFIGLADYSLSYFVGALRGTEDETVARFDLSRGSVDSFSTTAALVFLSCLNQSGSKVIRALSTTGSLPSVIETRRVCLVSNTTDRTLSFDLLIHPQSLSSSGFMGKAWDGSKVAYDVSVWRECLRVLKPGGHLLAFGGSRTYHRLACAIEDAGFEIRDQIQWLYGSGFPKSLDVSKAIDAAAGAEREVLGPNIRLGDSKAYPKNPTHVFFHPDKAPTMGQLTAPTTDAAKQWNGWGTALKPAHEPIVLARKPLIGTVAENVLKHGTGGLNIDGCRIEAADQSILDAAVERMTGNSAAGWKNSSTEGIQPNSANGRWPANVIHDGSEEVLAGFPNTSSGELGFSKHTDNGRATFWAGLNGERDGRFGGDSGSAARFFYCAKSSQEDRNEGLESLPIRSAGDVTDRKDGSDGLNSPRAGAGRTNGSRNHHPAVKPTDLMRYLCRLVTPPNGIVLDPFCGSGSTGKAAILERLNFIGIELSAEYCTLAEKRIEAVTRQGMLMFA